MSLLDRLPWRREVARLKALEAERARQMQLSGVMVLRHEARQRQKDIEAGHLRPRCP
jgi:hypothetical protein